MCDKTLLRRRFQNKRGITLVEVLVAAALLVILIAAVIAVISFSNTLLGKNIVSENAYTQAEGMADVLISALSSGTTDIATLEDLANASYAHAFTETPHVRQFSFQEVSYSENGLIIRGYEISVRINDEDGNAAARITAFASKPRQTS
jgi:type II secretory pathway pseudopilin PulG